MVRAGLRIPPNVLAAPVAERSRKRGMETILSRRRDRLHLVDDGGHSILAAHSERLDKPKRAICFYCRLLSVAADHPPTGPDSFEGIPASMGDQAPSGFHLRAQLGGPHRMEYVGSGGGSLSRTAAQISDPRVG